MGAPPSTRAEHSDEAAAISRLVVSALTTLTGKGPSRVRTRYEDEFITVVLEGVLSKPELALLAGGFADQVLESRRSLQALMSVELIEGVQDITERAVAARMSSNHFDPDMSVEVFVLEPTG